MWLLNFALFALLNLVFWADAQSSTSCPVECEKQDQFGVTWVCCGGSVCKKACPQNAQGNATWICGINNEFQTEWPDLSNCSSSWVQDIEDLIESGAVDSFTLLVYMDQFIQDETMIGNDISSALEFTSVSLELLLQEQSGSGSSKPVQLQERNYLSGMAMGTIDKLLVVDKVWGQLEEPDKAELGNQIQLVTEAFGFAITEKAAEIGKVYNTAHIMLNTHLEAQYLKRAISVNDAGVVKFPMVQDPRKSTIEVTVIPKSTGDEKHAAVNLEAVGNHIPMQYAEIMFPGGNNGVRKLNTGMVSLTLSIDEDKITPLHNLDSEISVLVTFVHERKAKGPLYSDVWRDMYPGEEPTAIHGTGHTWDSSGCRLVNSSHWHTTCECNHLSSFALIMDVHNFIGNSRALELLGIICSTLSVICLALMLLIIHFLKLNKDNAPETHLIQMLLIGHLMALFLLDRSYFNVSHDVCVGIGVVMHFIFLAAFTWMAIEGHHLYMKLVVVFDTGRDFSLIYKTAGYGIPLLIVTVTCFVTGFAQDYGYANDDLCWLSSPGYIWAFMGPVLFVNTINLVMFVIVMKVAVSAVKRRQKKKVMDRVKIFVRNWLSLSAVLGVTWIFGFIYFQVEPAFAYVFVILNGCQGVFIFLAKVVFNKRVRKQLLDKLELDSTTNKVYGWTGWKTRRIYKFSIPKTWTFGIYTNTEKDDNRKTIDLTRLAPIHINAKQLSTAHSSECSDTLAVVHSSNETRRRRISTIKSQRITTEHEQNELTLTLNNWILHERTHEHAMY